MQDRLDLLLRGRLMEASSITAHWWNGLLSEAKPYFRP